MLAIGIETSGREGSVAIVRDTVCLDERPLSRTGRRHARTLVLELREMLESVGIAPGQLDVVAVSIGPGSFTGLRVGVVCAKTIAWAARVSLFAVDSFAAVARNAPSDVAAQYVIGDAQRGDVFVSRYHRTCGGWERDGDIRIVPFEGWRDELPANAVISGPGMQVYGTQFAESTRLLEPECWTPKASHVARIGLEPGGIPGDPFLVEPFYIRRSSAEEKLPSAQTIPESPHS